MMAKRIEKELQSLRDVERSKKLEQFFKCEKGGYGEGDKFLGVIVPKQRKVAKKYYAEASLKDVQQLLENVYHECRLTALFILVYRYEKAEEKERQKIYNFYIRNLRYINSWDLIDATAPKIVGAYLFENQKKKGILLALAQSQNVWKRRVAALAAFTFIKNDQYSEFLKIAAFLVNDEHDLIHKAVGWMLREIGKKNQRVEEKFLKKHYKAMPRTMLRYAIEKFPEKKRKRYMQK